MRSLFFLFFTLLPFSLQLFAQTDSLVTFSERPRKLQLFTCDEQDSAAVLFSGDVLKTGYDHIDLVVYKNGVEAQSYSQELSYQSDKAAFELGSKIHAELTEYSFRLNLLQGGAPTSVLFVDSVVCGDAYIINGQSNAHYAWENFDYQNEFCRTFGVNTGSSNYNPYDPADTLWSIAQGNSELGAGTGTLGLYIQKFILEEYSIPTMIINGGTGGSVISEHQINESDRMDLSSIYGKLLYRVTKSGITTIKAIIWHQGENDSEASATSAYPDLFNSLYNGWMTDYHPQKIYLYQIHPGCGGSSQARFREMQRQLPVTLNHPNITLISTCGLNGHDGCHYSLDGYRMMALWVYNLIRMDFYGSQDTQGIYSPNVQKAFYDRFKQQVVVVFDQQNLIWPQDSLSHELKDYFYLDDVYGVISSGRASHDSLFLQLRGPNFFEQLTYLPDIHYNDNYDTYEGPWLRNSRGMGALSFYHLSVQHSDTTVKIISPNGGEIWNPSTSQNIEWSSNIVDMVRLQYTADSGKTWTKIADSVNATDGVYAWTTPDLISANCRIRISAVQDSTIADESDLSFGIFAKSLDILAPNGGEAWSVGSTQKITWSSEFIDKLRIAYSTDNGSTWKTVKRVTDATPGEVDWIIPDDVSDQCLVELVDVDKTSLIEISDAVFSIVAVSGLDETNKTLPTEYSLAQNHPNPFNPQTVIDYQLPENSHVRISVYDITGKEITVLVDKNMQAGNHHVNFDALKYNLSSGVYLYKIESGDFTSVRKMVLFK